MNKKWPRSAAIGYHINASGMPASILDGILCITIGLFGCSGYLLAEAFNLLLFATDQFPSFLLHFTGDIFCSSFDLIFIHVPTPSSKFDKLAPERVYSKRNISDGLYGN